MRTIPCQLRDWRCPKALKVLSLTASVAVLLLLGTAAFADGSSAGDPRTFGAYQVDFDSGPVGITIRGHSATEVVKISEQNLPSDIRVRYVEHGGILHVTVTRSADSSATAGVLPNARIFATMPRYEFVHIKTTSGLVSIDNLSTDHLTIQTEAGDIRVINTNAALKVASTTGNQSYDQIYGAIDATSTTGDINAAHTWGIMKLQSNDGSFAGKNIAIAGTSSFHTATGSIKMLLSYGFSRYSFDLHSTTGEIRLGKILRTGSLRWGEGNISFSATTTTGDQDIQ